MSTEPEPAPKAKAGSKAKPGSTTGATTKATTKATPEATTKASTEAKQRPARGGFLRTGGPFVLAGALALAALVLVVARPGDDGGGNVAVVDARETAQLVDAVTTGVEGAFAYDFRDPGTSEDAAAGFFTGDAVDDYQTLRDAVSSLGEEQSLVYETEVTEVGVQRLEGDEAEVLAFVDQTSTRGSDGAVEEAPAQLVLDLERNGGTWQVSSLEQL